MYKIAVGVLQTDGTYKIKFYQFDDNTQVLFTAMTTDAKTIIGSNGPYFMIGENTGQAGQYVFHQEMIPTLALYDSLKSVAISQNGQYIFGSVPEGLVIGTRINN